MGGASAALWRPSCISFPPLGEGAICFTSVAFCGVPPPPAVSVVPAAGADMDDWLSNSSVALGSIVLRDARGLV